MENKLLSLFQSRVQDSGGWCEVVVSQEKVFSTLREKYAFDKDKVVLSGRVTRELNITGFPCIDIDTVKTGERRELLVNAKLGLTLCDGLIAETGTVVLLNHPSETRELSLLPECHVVIAVSGQLYESLDVCFSKIKNMYTSGSMPSITLVSGPSKTADIEKTIVVGVHGPREFGVIIIDENDPVS